MILECFQKFIAFFCIDLFMSNSGNDQNIPTFLEIPDCLEANDSLFQEIRA